MGLKALSSFLYGHKIDNIEHFISIDEGGGELTINLTPSGYTFSELATELQRALNAGGTLDYVVTADRATFKFTITASSSFDLLAGSGLYASQGAWAVIGFDMSDKTGMTTYTSDNQTGSLWKPQLPLFNYSPTIHRVGSLQATQDESGSGMVEVVSFGTVNYMDFEMRYITDRVDKPDLIELNRSGVEDAMAFLNYARLKNRVEFMEDRDDVSTFEKLILQKTANSGQGLEVQLYEMTSQNLQDYYETKSLSFRKVL